MIARRVVVGEPFRPNRSRTDGRFDHHLARGQMHDGVRGEELARRDRNTGDRQVVQIVLVGVPGHHRGRVEQVGHRWWSSPGTRRGARCNPRSLAGSPGRCRGFRGHPRTTSAPPSPWPAAPRPDRRRHRHPRRASDIRPARSGDGRGRDAPTVIRRSRVAIVLKQDRGYGCDRSFGNRRPRSPDLHRQARADTRSRPSGDQGRSDRGQFHRHLFSLRVVPAAAAVRRRHRGVRHGGRSG